jgi:hypothetical protein
VGVGSLPSRPGTDVSAPAGVTSVHPLAVVSGLLGAALLLAGPEERESKHNPAARGRGHPVRGRFFRVVAGATPTERDFLSNRAKGLRPREAERADADLYDGLSVFRRRDDAWRIAHDFPRLGTHIAELRIGLRSGITGRPTRGRYPSHWTLWGDPAAFLRAVAGRPIPVDGQGLRC